MGGGLEREFLFHWSLGLIANRDAYWASLFSSVSLNKDSSRIVKRVSMHIATVPSLLAGGDMSRSGTGSR